MYEGPLPYHHTCTYIIPVYTMVHHIYTCTQYKPPRLTNQSIHAHVHSTQYMYYYYTHVHVYTVCTLYVSALDVVYMYTCTIKDCFIILHVYECMYNNSIVIAHVVVYQAIMSSLYPTRQKGTV